MEDRRRQDRRCGGAAPRLFLVPEGPGGEAVRVALGDEPVTIGREASCVLRDQNADVSRLHCNIERRADGVHVLSDAGSTFGTFVDGVRVTGEVVLRAGQVIGLGENGAHRIRVEALRDEEAAAPGVGEAAGGSAAEQRELVARLLAQVGATLDLDACLRRGAEIASETLGAERVWVLLLEQGELVERSHRGAVERLAEDAELPLDALRRTMARARVRQWLPGRGSTDNLEVSLVARGISSAWFLPLRAFDSARPTTTLTDGRSRCLGIVYAETRAQDPVRCDDAMLEYLALLSDILALQAANARLYHRATHDARTGLRNRSWLDERVDRALERAPRGATASLVVLDVDHFKRVNDTWGHDAGDAVLREVATRLRSVVGRRGAIARSGGEEFAVLLPGCSLEEAAGVAEALRSALERDPVVVTDRGAGQTEVHVTGSFGVATLDPAVMQRRDDLMRAGDEALYRAKAAGRNRVEMARLPSLPASG